MKEKIEKILVSLIILLSFFVKVYGLSKSPPSVNFDEAALGYNAYSILKTGKDEYGNFLPLSLRSFNDYKPALYAYLSIPFIKIFGLNEVSIRMVSVIAGTLSTVFLYFFLKKFIKERHLRIFILLILAFEPWRIHFSRVSLESNLSAALFIAGAYFLYKFRNNLFKKKTFLKLFLITIFFTLSAYSYHGARLAVPALIVLFVLDPIKLFFNKNLKIYWRKIVERKAKYLLVLVLFVILLAPVFLVNKSSQVLTRFRQENVFYRYFPFTPKELLNKDKNVWTNLGNNPAYYFLGIMFGHMLSYISPISIGGRVYHWVKGSVQYIPGFSMFGWLESIIFAVGLIYLIKNIKIKFKYRFIVYWIIAGAAPAALTWNWFHPLRSMNLYPALELIIAIGFVAISKYLKIRVDKKIYKLFSFGVAGLFLLTILFTIINEYGYSVDINHGEYQPGGFKEGVKILASMQDKYNEIIIDSPHAQSYIFFLFYQSFPPEIVQSYADIRPKPGVEGNLNFNFYKYKFEKYNWPEQRNKSKIMIWTSSEVIEDEIKNTKNANIIWVNNAVFKKASAIITKD